MWKWWSVVEKVLDSRVRVREEMVIQNRDVRAMENNLFGSKKKIMEFAFSYRYIS